MVQTAEPWHCYDPAGSAELPCGFPAGRRSLRQRKVSPVFMVIADVCKHEPFQVAFIEHDHVVEQISPQFPIQRSATPFCHGLRKLIRLGWMPKFFTVSITSLLNCGPRSKIR